MNIAFCCNMAYRPLHALYDCMLRFASVTVNLGPTFLSGALAANAGAVMDEPSCPLVQVTGHRQGGNKVFVHKTKYVMCCEFAFWIG